MSVVGMGFGQVVSVYGLVVLLLRGFPRTHDMMTRLNNVWLVLFLFYTLYCIPKREDGYSTQQCCILWEDG